MSAPREKSLKDLMGKWTMNRDLSSDVDPVLQIQGFSTLSRKAIAHAPVHLNVSQDDSQITIDQSTTANIPAIEEQWPYDWQMREHKDAVMGKVAAKSHWVQLSDVQGEDASWLTGEGWLDGGNGDDGKQVEAFVDGIDGGWTAHQVWGFESHNGQRYFVRRVAVRAKDGKQPGEGKADIRVQQMRLSAYDEAPTPHCGIAHLINQKLAIRIPLQYCLPTQPC